MSGILSFPDYLLFFIGTLNFIFSFFIYTNNTRNTVNISFAFYAGCLTIWTVLLLTFRIVPLEYASLAMRSIYVSGVLISIALWYFVHFFPKRFPMSFVHHMVVVSSTLIVSALLFIPDFIVRVVYLLPDGSRTVALNPIGYALFTLFFIFFYVGGLVLFWQRLRQSTRILKKQSQAILIGTTLAVIIGGFFNIILPSPFFGNYQYIYIGPVCSFVVILATAYGIAKYQLMNIKALVVEFFVITLIVILTLQLVLSKTFLEFVVHSVILLSVVLTSMLLVRSVVKEVKRREELDRMAKNLERANFRLQELDLQKTEFLSIASHQLRTPLSIIKGYIELIDDGAYGKVGKKMHTILHNMDESNERLVRLVNEFLNITRLEQDRTKYVFAKTDIVEIISSVVVELALRAKDKGMSLSWKKPKDNFSFTADEEKIRQVIFNYIDNAIKYADRGPITVTVKKEGGGIAVRVQDRGVGFEKGDEVNFFQKFYRGENVKGTNINGTGLGLYVCRKFIEAHGGKVWGRSNGLKKGSEFGFLLPKQSVGRVVEMKNDRP